MLKLSIKEAGPLVPPRTLPANARVEIWRNHAGAVYAYGGTLGEECWMHVPGLASFRFSASGNEVSASVSHGVEEGAVVDTYRRRVLPMALQVGGREVLHASAVRSPDGIIALCGSSLTGKSTIAFGLSQRGYELWGDDAFIFEPGADGTVALSVPFEIRLRPASANWFGQPAIPADNRELPYERAPVNAVCILRRTTDERPPVVVRRLPFAEAFTNLLTHACWFTMKDDDDKRRVINHYMDLAAQTPVFDVAFKTGLEHLDDVLNAIEKIISQSEQTAGL